MSAHELGVQWPEFFAYRQREEKRQEEKAREAQRGRRFKK